jgi:hypothetical protein
VQQRGRAERRVAVARQLAAREAVQFRVERREQRLAGAGIAAIRRRDERADLGQDSSRLIAECCSKPPRKCSAARILLSAFLDRK